MHIRQFKQKLASEKVQKYLTCSKYLMNRSRSKRAANDKMKLSKTYQIYWNIYVAYKLNYRMCKAVFGHKHYLLGIECVSQTFLGKLAIVL